MNLKEKVTNKVGSRVAEQNPFLTSEHFLGLMKATAALSKVILLASSSPAEAMNGVQSVVVTFLKNIPDAVWVAMTDVLEKHRNDPAYETFVHLDALRNYGGSENQRFVEIVEEGDDMPPVNAPAPKHPC